MGILTQAAGAGSFGERFHMAVLNIFSPGKLTVGGNGGNFQTQFVSNPWGSGAVWIQ
jgi:hypothetical protein